MNVQANIAVPTEFNTADATYRQAVTASSNASSIAAATTGFTQAAAQFTAAATAATNRRRQAEEAVAKAKAASAESVAHATSVGRIMDGNIDGETEVENE
jgi:hydroxymethylpyrimidine/phosphomethylpyrimidine kinase